ncbi:hypothetical protein [Muricoccus nepalensis]|uniref:hypothetical protein n=1 Tax=Muricoccus nepalensis TaxID=1854500 RepID=UPI00112B8A00|nr:hypothetical protein [Roseomonas nepalensis]
MHAKLDRLLAEQAQQSQSVSELVLAMGSLVEGIAGLLPRPGTRADASPAARNAACHDLLTQICDGIGRIEAVLEHQARQFEISPSLSARTPNVDGEGSRAA